MLQGSFCTERSVFEARILIDPAGKAGDSRCVLGRPVKKGEAGLL